jgi:plastocyanin
MTNARRVVARAALAGIAVVVMGGAGGCAQPATTIDVATQEHDFQPEVLLVPTGQAAKVIYRNQEEGTEHNFAIYGRQGGELIARSDTIVGPDGVTELVLPPLAPGTYFVQCDIHPFMTAALTARVPGSSPASPSNQAHLATPSAGQ